MRRYALLLFLILTFVRIGSGETAPLVLDGLGRMTVPVDGAWQFKTGDDLAWASPTLDDSGWEQVQAGRSWEGQGHRDYNGFGWYRRHIVIPAGTPADLNLAMFLPVVIDAADVYWNGRLVGSFGKVPPNPAWFVTYSPQTYQLGAAQSGVIALRVWSAPVVYLNYPEQGGLQSIPQLGTAEGIAAVINEARYHALGSNQVNLAVALGSVIIGLLAFFSWLRDRSRWMLFWLAFPMLRPLVKQIIFTVPGYSTFKLAYGSIGEVVSITGAATWFLLLYLLDLHTNRGLVRWTKILAVIAFGLTTIDTVMVQFDWTRLLPRQFLYWDIASTLPVELLELYVVVIVGFALRKRLDAARWILAITSVVAALEQAVTDIGGLGNRWTHWTVEAQVHRPIIMLGGSSIDAAILVNLFLLGSILYAAWRYSVERNQRQTAIEQEFLSAQEIQKILIPDVLPDIAGYSVTSAYYPAQEVGGDFYQIIPLGGEGGDAFDKDRGAIVVLGDVSGKGLKAAMTVSLLVGAIRSTVEATQDPAEILTALNRRLYGRMQNGFATCLVLRLDAFGDGTLANAGHLPPFINENEFALSPALPLGLVSEAEYETTALRLEAGDRLTLYTDGLLEARSAGGELFGFARIAEVSGRSSEQIARAAQEFGQDDDITVLTLTGAGG